MEGVGMRVRSRLHFHTFLLAHLPSAHLFARELISWLVRSITFAFSSATRNATPPHPPHITPLHSIPQRLTPVRPTPPHPSRTTRLTRSIQLHPPTFSLHPSLSNSQSPTIPPPSNPQVLVNIIISQKLAAWQQVVAL